VRSGQYILFGSLIFLGCTGTITLALWLVVGKLQRRRLRELLWWRAYLAAVAGLVIAFLTRICYTYAGFTETNFEDWTYRALKFDDGMWSFPFGCTAIPSLCATVIVFTLITRRWAVNEGFCRNCNYDLTGNTSGGCPECGQRVPSRNDSD